MANNVDVYNGDIVSMLPGSQQDPPLYKSISGDGVTDRNSVGEIQAIKLDMTKAGNTFIDLRPIFNANQSDGNIEMPILPFMYGQQVHLDGFRGEIHGLYPDKKHTFNIDTALGNTGNIYRFLWPSGVFQATGKYVFTFTFINDKTGEKITSKECFFEVEPNLLTMAVNFSEGISPFDSEYERWKAKINAQMSTLQDTLDGISKTASALADTVSAYTKTVNSTVDNAFNKKLGQANNWTAKQTMSEAEIGNLTVDDWFDAKKDLTVEQALHVKGSADLPSNVTLANPILKYESNNLAAGLFPCEGYWFAHTDSSKDVAAWFVNGVTGSYMSFRKFRYTARDGDSNSALMEIHSNCKIPSSAFGKPVVQFNNGGLEGIDQTPFVFGNHQLQFDVANNVLKCIGYADGVTNDWCIDARMI